jgi:hypothetical protein
MGKGLPIMVTILKGGIYVKETISNK